MIILKLHILHYLKKMICHMPGHPLLTEKKYSTKDVDKVTDELVFMKQQVNTIHRKGLYQFRVNISGIRDGLN